MYLWTGFFASCRHFPTVQILGSHVRLQLVRATTQLRQQHGLKIKTTLL